MVTLTVLCLTCDCRMLDITTSSMHASVFYCPRCKRSVQIAVATTAGPDL